jgi:1-acyl-sn-glycerol-3-phosphate acyltransferase
LLYWVLRWFAVGPLVRLLFQPWVEGEENIPARGAAILVSNHISAGDTFLLPAMIKRPLIFPAKAELFTGRGIGGRLTGWFMQAIGQLPMDRSGGRASAGSMEGVLRVLTDGHLLGIYPEGTRSPDGRLYKGKTGVARLVLRAGVPVVPIAMINTQFVASPIPKVKTMRRPGIRIGRPMDFRRYRAGGNDRAVLRYVTDEIMNAVMELSGQDYVEAYGSSVKAAQREGRDLPVRAVTRPGEGTVPPELPPVADRVPPTQVTATDVPALPGSASRSARRGRPARSGRSRRPAPPGPRARR